MWISKEEYQEVGPSIVHKRWPQRWRERFPLCAGRRQSPIDIVTDTTMRETSTVSDRIVYRPSTAVMGTFVNTGHGPAFIANRNSTQNVLRMVGHGRSRPRYVFRELRFRIGANQSAFGSEHTVNGIGYTGEIQLLNNRIGSRRRGTVIAVGIFFNVVQQCGSYADQLISNYV
ncbi:carbonic anhydrase 1-like [Argopecten irradians]|uniref:carbonic anhydrase 1-like n=1 Tax=Argopecten irradians TaxID=31199 RepID=UPI003721AE4B